MPHLPHTLKAFYKTSCPLISCLVFPCHWNTRIVAAVVFVSGLTSSNVIFALIPMFRVNNEASFGAIVGLFFAMMAFYGSYNKVHFDLRI
jgi:hypothetical protein